jgi:hypothetical protein
MTTKLIIKSILKIKFLELLTTLEFVITVLVPVMSTLQK